MRASCGTRSGAVLQSSRVSGVVEDRKLVFVTLMRANSSCFLLNLDAICIRKTHDTIRDGAVLGHIMLFTFHFSFLTVPLVYDRKNQTNKSRRNLRLPWNKCFKCCKF